jgi:hypothetical protein
MVLKRLCIETGVGLGSSRFSIGTSVNALVIAFALAAGFATAAVPDYKLGDVAQEDVITPVPLQVINPEATEALKIKVAQQLHLIVLQTTQTAGQAEAELRESIAAARTSFVATLQRALNGRAPRETDLDSAAYSKTVRDVARESPKDLPLDKLAPLWVRGASDAAIVENLVQPVRDVMVQPIVASKTDSTFPANQPVRLIAVKNASQPPGIRELESAGQTVSSGKIISLWRARRLVETHFPAGQEELGKFAAAFVRANAQPDPGLTEIVRAKRMEGVTVNDTYDAAQVVVRKGQTIDRKALSALAVLREKSLIGTLQTKLEQEQSVVGQSKQQTTWIAASLGAVCVVLALILWRRRARPGTALVPLGMNPALIGDESAADAAWRNRALVAEAKAERAHAAVRSGVLGWMRERIFQTLSRHRAELLSTQQKAEIEMRELEQRLEQLHTPLQERIQAYEKRIAELEKDLAAKGEENRELIGARIAAARQQLNLERERGDFGAN